MEKKSFKYFAFISYSHKDKKIAKKLQRRIEHYHLPSTVRKSYPELPKKLSPIFLDESNLVATGTLKTALQANLDRAKYLIVICSPNSANSEYVNNEVDYFIKSCRAEQIIPLIVDGIHNSENECFPPALLALQREQEILGMNLKKCGVRDSFLRIIATLLNLDTDAFILQENRERKKRMMILSPIVATLMLITCITIWHNIDLFNEMLYSDTIQYDIGTRYYEEHDYARAIEWLEKAAIKGNANAQNRLADMYLNGIETKQSDIKKAIEYYEKAAKQGHTKAQEIIKYLNIEKSAVQGDIHAQYWLAYMYRYGDIVEQDYGKAIKWYEKAANQDNAFAQFELGDM